MLKKRRRHRRARGEGSEAGKRGKRLDQHGVAILMVLAALAVLLPFVANFNMNAHVEWQSSVNSADEVKARNLHRGATRLSGLMFELQRRVFNQKQFRQYVGAMDITMVAPYLMSVFGTPDGAEGLGALVGVNTTALNDLAIPEGEFDVRLEAEGGKINVNCLADAQAPNRGSGKNKGKGIPPRDRTVQVLEQIMIPTLYDPLFDEEKSDGQRYNRQDVLQAMVDYLDDDTRKFDLIRLRSTSVGERYRYRELYDPYEVRNARLDTLEELHLVEGVDDDFMAAFGGHLTTYGSCKVNLNFASADQIALVLRHAASSRDKWKTEGESFLTMTMPLANFVVEQRMFNLFDKLDDVKKLVAKPDQYVNPITLFGDEAEQDTANLPKVPDGMEVRVNEGCRDDSCWGGLREVATVEPERTYRVEVTTQVGSARKRLTGVYDLQYTRSQSQGKGAWLYYREE